MTYPGTNLPLASGYPIDQLRTTLLAGPGPTGLYSDAINFLRMSETLTDAAGDLKAALGRLSEGLEGPAAAAAAQHITALVENGHAGAAQATLAYNGLIEQGDHHLRARQDMQAVPEQPDPDQQHVFAVDSATRYQNNANRTITDVFQTFVAPAATPINVAPAAAPHGADWGSPSGIGAAHLGAGGGTGNGSGLPGTPPPTGSGLNPSGTLPPGPAVAVRPGTPVQRPSNGGGPDSTAPGAGRTPTGVSPQRTSPGGGSFPAGDGADPGDRYSPDGTRAGSPPDERTSRPLVPGPPRTAGPGAEPWTPTGPPSQSWRNSQPWGTGYRSPTDQTPAGPGTWRSGAPHPAEPGAGHGMTPMMGGGGRGGDSEHQRPPWLLLDDPQAFWFSGMPAHTSPVLGATIDDETSPDRANGR